MLIVLTSTASNQRGPRFCEQVFANLSRYPFTLFVMPIDGAASLAIECKQRHQHAIMRELQAAYPDVRLRKKTGWTPAPVARRRTLNLRLFSSCHQLRTYQDFWNETDRSITDPVASLLTAIAPQTSNQGSSQAQCTIALQCKPASFLRSYFFSRRCERKQSEKASHALYRCRLRLTVEESKQGSRFARARLGELRSIFGQFVSGTPASFYSVPGCFARFWVNDTELSTLWHPTTASVKARTMQTNDSRELEAPLKIGSGKEEGSALLGKLTFGEKRTFGIQLDDRRRHCAVIGKTGMGKSTLLRNMIASDMEAGRGVGLIDPHGDLAEDVLSMVPKHRTGDVVLFDAGDREYPPAFDPLRCGQGSDHSLTASAVVGSFKKLFGDSWGPRLEYILRNAVLALLEVPGTSLLSLMQMLNDKRFRENLVNQVSDPLVRSFWHEEFAAKPVKWQEEAVAPIQNKVGQFLSSPLLRAIFGQVPGRIDLRKAMDEEKIFVANLSKGRIGEDGTNLLGALLVTGLQQAAMSRSDISEKKRKDFYLYVDEFQNFATDSFGTILSEARKYRLNLTIANQLLDQMEEGIRQAVFGNCGSFVVFQVGITDAEVLAPQLAGDVSPLDLISLPKYQAYVRLLVDGMPSKPFSMETLPPLPLKGADRTEKIRRTSRRQYAKPASMAT